MLEIDKEVAAYTRGHSDGYMLKVRMITHEKMRDCAAVFVVSAAAGLLMGLFSTMYLTGGS